MKRFSAGLLGLGTVINGISVVLRPSDGGYRIYANHQPCANLPDGGYVRKLNEAERTVTRYEKRICASASSLH